MADPVPADSKKFSAAILPMFFCIFVLSLLVSLSLLLIRRGGQIRPHAYEAAVVFAAFWAFVGAWMVSRFCPIALSAEGIYGHSFWGPPRFVRWREMAAARTFQFFNLPLLRIYSATDNKVTWLPLFLSRKAEFGEEARRLAPPDSPLLKHLP